MKRHRLSFWRYLDTDILYKSINFQRLNKIYSLKKSFMYEVEVLLKCWCKIQFDKNFLMKFGIKNKK